MQRLIIKKKFIHSFFLACKIFLVPLNQLYSCQEEKFIPLQDIVCSYKHLDEGFELTQQELSFHVFLDVQISSKNIHDENFALAFADTITQAECIVLDPMKDIFLEIVTTTAQCSIPILQNLDHPYYRYIKKNHHRFSQPYIQNLINAQDEYGNSLLHKIINTFIFKPNSPDGMQQLSCLKHMVSNLIAMGADINLANKEGLNCLHVMHNYKIIEILLYAGANVNQQNVHGLTPLHKAAAYKNHCHDRHCKVSLLLKYGANPHIPDNQGKKPLHLAVQGNNLTAVQALLQKKVDVNAKDNNGWTPLHYAAKYNSSDEIARNLIGHNACIDTLNYEAQTPLYLAAQSHHAKTVEMLVTAGADATIFDRQPNVRMHKNMHNFLRKAQKPEQKDCTIS